MKKILIIKHGSLGDLILSFGAIKTIKHQFPNADLFLVTQTNFKEIFNDVTKFIIDEKGEEIISDYESKENESSNIKKEDDSKEDSDSNSFTNIEFEDI